MNLFPIDRIMEADVRNQNPSSIMAEEFCYRRITMTKGALRTHNQSGTNTTIKLII